MEHHLILDSVDKKILKKLSFDARIKVVEIASALGVTAAAIHQRIAKIKKAGVIRSFTLQLNEKALGYRTCAFVGVFMSKNSEYTQVVKQLLTIDEVVEAHYTTGQYALFLKIYAKDNDHLMLILSKKVHNIQGITQTETFISLEEPINRGIPLP